jgi:hypothetical protein
MAKNLDFLKMPEKAGDEAAMDEELGPVDSSMSESGVDLSDVTDEELQRECEKRGMKCESAEGDKAEGEEEGEDSFQFPSGLDEEEPEEE